MKKIWYAVQTVLLLIIAVCSVIVTFKVLSWNPSVQQTAPDVTEESTVASTEPTTVTTEPTAVFDSAMYTAFDTPYGPLYYPKEYSSYLKTATAEENGVFSMTFSYDDGTVQRDMYKILFGDSEQGSLIGTFGDGTAFTVEILERSDEVTNNSEDMIRYHAMLEAINDIIRSVEQFEGYVRA